MLNTYFNTWFQSHSVLYKCKKTILSKKTFSTKYHVFGEWRKYSKKCITLRQIQTKIQISKAVKSLQSYLSIWNIRAKDKAQ